MRRNKVISRYITEDKESFPGKSSYLKNTTQALTQKEPSNPFEESLKNAISRNPQQQDKNNPLQKM